MYDPKFVSQVGDEMEDGARSVKGNPNVHFGDWPNVGAVYYPSFRKEREI